MRELRLLTVVLAIALASGAIHCAFACVVLPCRTAQTPSPPCHQHNKTPQPEPAQHCLLTASVDQELAQPDVQQAAPAAVAAVSLQFSLLGRPERAQFLPPRMIDFRPFAVLRI
jgi:hypothetical protein